MPANFIKYVLVTAAKNEQAYIEKTLDSVVNQTVLPQRWIIVSDGSTDRTDDIVSDYARRYPWIELMRMPERNDRDFSGKAVSFNSGYQRIKQIPHQAVGSLDADLSFSADYFSFLLEKFESDPGLGVAGTPFSEGGETYDYRFSSPDYVSGACQLFRRECFDQIGGYVPVKGGGIDVIAVMTARLNGWRARTFTDKVCIHHRPMSSANHKDKLMASFKLGQRAYRVGFHPVWQVFRSIYQMTRKPYLTGGLALFFGYFSSMLRRAERPISRELMEFQRRDQMRRLREFFFRMPGMRKHKNPVATAPHGAPVRQSSGPAKQGASVIP